MEKKCKRQYKSSIKHDCLSMAKYLQEDNFGYTVQQKQNLFKCRMKDIDVKANRRWKYENINCLECNEPNQIETQEHVLCCKALTNKNFNISYVPTYTDLFSDNIEEQVYTSTILCENLRISRVPT